MIDSEDLKDMYTRLQLANGAGRDLSAIPHPQVLWWASYYRGDVQALLEELAILDDALMDIMDLTGLPTEAMSDAEKVRVIQDLGYVALDIRRSKEVQG